MYRILSDYGLEGLSMLDEEFISITEAIEYMMKYCEGNPWQIIKTVDIKKELSEVF